MDGNHWQLYEDSGWQECLHRLDVGLAEASENMDVQIAEGASIPAAATEAFRTMEKLLFLRENAQFGAADGEPSSVLGSRLTRYIRTRYGLERFRISGYGDIDESSPPPAPRF
jgi:hypothetical protein